MNGCVWSWWWKTIFQWSADGGSGPSSGSIAQPDERDRVAGAVDGAVERAP